MLCFLDNDDDDDVVVVVDGVVYMLQ